MILRETPEFKIECDVDDEKSQRQAAILADVMSLYELDTNDERSPLKFDVDGIVYTLTYKALVQ
jgi:hypothetical protein